MESYVVGKLFSPASKSGANTEKQGGERILGIPTVTDRVAQMVVKLTFEPSVEPFFLQIPMDIDRTNRH